MRHTDEYGRSLTITCEEITVTEGSCVDDAGASVALPEGEEALPLLRHLLEATALDWRYDLVAKETANG